MGIVSQYGLSFYTIGTGLSMDFFVFIHFLFADFTKIPGLIQKAGFIFYSYSPIEEQLPHAATATGRPLSHRCVKKGVIARRPQADVAISRWMVAYIRQEIATALRASQ